MADDIIEFLEKTSKHIGITARSGSEPVKSLVFPFDEEEDEKTPKSSVSQYAQYGDIFRCVGPTIKTIPAACYEFKADQSGVFIEKVSAPSGLLLQLPEMRSEDVINIINNFWSSEKDYKEGNEFVIGGAQYKAGIMLWGPPGSGKSCTLKLVSKQLIEQGGVVFYASVHPSIMSSFLNEFRKIEPDRKCIIILEDIDSLINYYGESSYLDLLDSARTIDNVLFLATTNYPERLDPRIYNRPGRFSHVIKVGLPTPKAREAYLKAILKNHKDVDYIVKNTDGFTIDHLTSLVNAIYREKKELEPELKRLKQLFKVKPTSEDLQDGISLK